MCKNHALSVFCLIACSFFLAGFKQTTSKLPAMAKNQAVETEKQPKKLDLSVSQSDISFQDASELSATTRTSPSGIIAINKQIENRPLELQGKVIMSQEPEVGKTKSADGAGIVINIHH